MPRGGFEVTRRVTSASELRGRSPVRIAGVDVGPRRRRSSAGPGTTARRRRCACATARGRCTRDATLKVRPRLFLEGNFFVDLRPGSPSAPELERRRDDPARADRDAGAARPGPHRAADRRRARSSRRSCKELGTALGDGGGARSLGPRDRRGRRRRQRGDRAGGERAARHRAARPLAGRSRQVGKVTAALDARREQLAGAIDGFDGTVAALAAEDAALRATLRGARRRRSREALPAVREIRAALPGDARVRARRPAAAAARAAHARPRAAAAARAARRCCARASCPR